MRGAACTFSHGAEGAEDDHSDPEMQEILANLAQASGKKDEASADDAVIMESLQKAEEDEVNADQAAQQRERCSSSGGSDSGDLLPPPASEAEIEEARLIVQKAQREAQEREKMKATASAQQQDFSPQQLPRVASQPHACLVRIAGVR